MATHSDRQRALAFIDDNIASLKAELREWQEMKRAIQAAAVGDLDASETRHDLLRTLLSEHDEMHGCSAHQPCQTRKEIVEWIRDITRTVFR